MKLIVIYGPPAAGKLTVGKELAKLTGYKLFHNHLAIDLVHEIYDWDHPAFFTLVYSIRTAVIESAAASGTDLILTFFYTGTDREEAFFKRIEAVVGASGGNTVFVQLTAPLEVLLGRVEDQSRKQFGKLTTKESLLKVLKSHNNTAYGTQQHLTLDTARMQPAEMAQAIKDVIPL